MAGELIKLLKLAQGDRSLNAFARHADVSPGNLSRIMNGQKPTPEILKKLAEKAQNNVNYEDLMIAAGYLEEGSNIDSKPDFKPVLTAKDEKDIAKDLDSLMSKLKNEESGPLYYNGNEVEEEDAELFKGLLEVALKKIKIKNKETYTPKKYRK